MSTRCLSFILLFATSLVAHDQARAQENRGTLEQQMACTPDVFRLCGSEIPDVDRIVACLRHNTDQLGDSCKAVFDAKHNTTSGSRRSH